MIKKREIKDLAYILNKVKNDPTQPKPIVLLGAGASISAGIPSANDIAKEILKQFSDKPAINRLTEDEKKDYYHLMSALSSDERRNIFTNYINSEEVKINVTHIYLAQLLLNGYIDYVFTPNFDDLLLKACALFNKIPPVYDISNFNDFTTTNFQNQSITYLHGQHHGQWLLNAKGELEKTKDIIPKLFNKVCNRRTWIIIGYSGNDELLDELAKFESFDNELYWIGYNDYEPIDRVKEKLLGIELKNAYLISGYDSDSFFLQLHSELKMETPEIFNKPFSFIQSMMKNIKDIEEYKSDDTHKEKFENVKVRFEKSKEMVRKGINDIENEPINKLEQDIIEAIVKYDFSKINLFYDEVVQLGNTKLDKVLADLFNNYGNQIYDLANKKNQKDLFHESAKQFEIATELNPKHFLALNNWGNTICKLATLSLDRVLFENSFEKYRKAIEFNPEYDIAFTNLGHSISILAELEGKERLFQSSFEMFEKAIELNEKNYLAYNSWGVALHGLSKLLASNELLNQAIEKYKKAIQINPQNEVAYSNWGNAITDIAFTNLDEELFNEALKKYKISLSFNSKNNLTYVSCAYSLLKFFHLNNDTKILDEAFKMSSKAYDLDNKHSYNLACCYSLMMNKKDALKYLEEALNNKNAPLKHITEDKDWDYYKDDKDFKELIKEYTLKN